MTEANPLPPPGWYPDGVTPGVLRWFDGTGWSERTVPVPETPALAPEPAPVPVAPASARVAAAAVATAPAPVQAAPAQAPVPAAPAPASPASAPAPVTAASAPAPVTAAPLTPGSAAAGTAPVAPAGIAHAAPPAGIAHPGSVGVATAGEHDDTPWRTPGAHTAAGVVAPAHARRPAATPAGPAAPVAQPYAAQPYAAPTAQAPTAQPYAVQPGAQVLAAPAVPAPVAPAPATWGQPQTTAWYPEPPRPGSSPRDSLHWLVPVGRSWQSIVAGYLGLFAIVVWPLGPVALVFGIWALRKAQVGGHGRGRAVLALVVGVLATVALAFAVVTYLAAPR